MDCKSTVYPIKEMFAPSRPPESFTRTPLSMNLARSRAFSFLDMSACDFIFYGCIYGLALVIYAFT